MKNCLLIKVTAELCLLQQIRQKKAVHKTDELILQPDLEQLIFRETGSCRTFRLRFGVHFFRPEAQFQQISIIH